MNEQINKIEVFQIATLQAHNSLPPPHAVSLRNAYFRYVYGYGCGFVEYSGYFINLGF